MPNRPAPAVNLYSALSMDAAWAEVIRPWLARATARARFGQSSCVVVVPSRALAVALKIRALVGGMNLLGIRFWLPGELREEMMRARAVKAEVPSRDAQRLLAATIGEQLERESVNSSARQVAGAVARSPDAFLRAFDQLDQGGWDPLQHLPPALRDVAGQYASRLLSAGFQRVPHLDRQLKELAETSPSIYSELLVVGFDGGHWPVFPLLRGAAKSSDQATIVFTEPRDEARTIDSLWIGSWEQDFAATTPVAGEDRARPMSNVLNLPESKAEIEHRAGEPAPCIDFLVGETATELAQIISQRVLQDLATCESPRLAVVFPKASALSRLVSKRLADAGVPHNDALGHPLADATEDPAWTAWLKVQDDRRVAPFAKLVEECRTVPQLSPLGATVVARRLWKELGEILIDDLPVLVESLSSRTLEPIAQTIAVGLREIIWLPESVDAVEMYRLTLRAFAQLGWHGKAIDLRQKAAGWIGQISGTISRTFWLRWIADALAFTERQREMAGRHPYARVHLISFAEAASLEWTHVILGGLNEKEWPVVPDDDGWLTEAEVAALNARARTVNPHAVEQGRHGEGHDALRSGHTWCLTSADARGILHRQLLNLMENVSDRVAATATIRSAEEPERVSPPGEVFGRLYFCARGRAVSPAVMDELLVETSRWLSAIGLPPGPAPRLEEVEETRRAWDARRKEGRAFGEYEFALRSAPTVPISLAATDWERALTCPAHVFLEQFLGVTEPDEADPDLAPRAIGTWAHRWLSKIGGDSRDGAFRPLLSTVEREKMIERSAAVDRRAVESFLAACQRSIPDWWVAIWREALATAIALVRKLPGSAEWTHCATEFRLGATSLIVPDGSTLRFSGQIDLLLAQAPAGDGTRVPAGLVWIVDYKTGEPKPLKPAGLARGDGLQLALYGMAARLAGASSVQMSRIGRTLDLGSGQITGDDLDGLESLWGGLVQIQETGRFGLLGPIRSAYGNPPVYPLATLAVDESLLKSKWTVTHPKLNGGAE